MFEEKIIINQNEKPKERIFELLSNKENKFIVTFNYKNSSSLFVSSILDDGIIKTFYEKEFAIEKIKENKAFGFYETFDEILAELFPLIDEGKVHLFEEIKNENKFIKIIFDLPFKKYNKLELNLDEKKKTDLEKINELYNIIKTQNKNINDLRNDFKDMKIKIENLEKKVLEQKKFEEDLIINTNSSIFKSLDEISFIIE